MAGEMPGEITGDMAGRLAAYNAYLVLYNNVTWILQKKNQKIECYGVVIFLLDIH